MIGYYPACELFELCGQEQLIYIFGCSKPLLETKKWMLKDLETTDASPEYCWKYHILSLSKKKYWNPDNALSGACFGQHLSLINLLIEKGATNFNSGLDNACIVKNFYIINLMIEKGANDLNWALKYACAYKNYDVINFLIEKGATYCPNCLIRVSHHPR